MKVALWRLGSGLIVLPAQVISLFLVFHGAGEAVGDLYRRLLPPAGAPRGRAREGAPLFGLLLLGIPVAMAMSGAALTMIFTLVRMVYYPFWALSAPAADLRHSWGGPTPAGATLVHWLVGFLVSLAFFPQTSRGLMLTLVATPAGFIAAFGLAEINRRFTDPVRDYVRGMMIDRSWTSAEARAPTRRLIKNSEVP